MSARLHQQLFRATWTPPAHHLLAGQSFRLKSTSPSHLTPHQQLVELHRLITEARASNSPYHKRNVIISYPHLRDLLEIIHDPNVRFHLTPASLSKYLSDPSASSQVTSSLSVPKTLVELLEQLASKRISGNAAKMTVRLFLEENEIRPEDKDVYGTFLRVIDRGLDAGFGTTILSKLEWPGDEGSRNAGPSLRNAASGSSSTSTVKSSPAIPSSSSASSTPTFSASSNSPAPSASAAVTSARLTPQSPRNLTKFSCTLGKSVDANFGRMIGAERWFASRKLDGIRVLTLLDFYIPHDTSQPITFDTASFRSRSGNAFTSLARLEEQLRHLAGYPGLRELLQNEPEVIEERTDGVVKRLVLDGEVCHMVPARGQTVRVGDDGTGASALWEDDGLVEDFQTAVSMVRRNMTMDRPLYFVFDVLNWAEVASGGPVRAPGLGKTFRARVEDTRNLVGWLRDKIMAEGGGEPRVRAMIQREVQGKDDADAMVQRAMDEGWEGLIFRMDKPYKGKRSTEILKFKKFQDAEYAVVDVDTSRMRLAIGGKFDEYEALSNVWIEHKGHRVSVGTGFTAEERVRFGADPSQIIGKQMTVEYFSESQAATRDAGVSLRFPRVKKIWEGKRDV